MQELKNRNEKQIKQIERYDQERKLLTNQLQEMKRAFNQQEPGSLDRKLRDVFVRVARLRSRLLESITNLERHRPAKSAMGRDQGALDDKLQKVESKTNEYQQDLYELDVVLSVHHQGYQKSISEAHLPVETLRNVITFLDHQQKGLETIGDTVTGCNEDLDIILGKTAPPRVAPLVSGLLSNRNLNW